MSAMEKTKCTSVKIRDMKFMKTIYSGTYTLVVLGMALLVLAGCTNSEVPRIEDEETPEPVVLPAKLKILSYNILEGMKTDKPNNYDNFVQWIKNIDPDIIAFQEANGFRQKDLEKLAARWGHTYVITNVKSTDNYPVALTSKYPLESRRKVTLNTSHGAIFAQLKGTDFNIVTTHLWPQAYWHQTGDGLGNDYRLQEINIVLDSTIRKFSEEPNWILVGDFNSRSRKDYASEQPTLNYWVTDQIEEDGFEDAIHYLYGTRAAGVTYDFSYPGARIDFLFATRSVLRQVIRAYPIYDEFTAKYSDHPPFYMEVALK